MIENNFSTKSNLIFYSMIKFFRIIDRKWEEESCSPGVRNTFVVFLRFFHLARRFWNHTYELTDREKTIIIMKSYIKNMD